MRSLFIILFSLFFVLGYSQPPGYVPRKGYPYFVKDAKEKIIGMDIAGAFSVLAADTTSESLVQPPDTAQSFTVNVGGTGEPFTSLKTEIRSAWTFEESSGNAVDSLGLADLPLFGSGITQGATGIINNGISFTGSGYLGDIDTHYELTKPFTVLIWVKTLFGGNYQGFITNYGLYNRGWDLLQSNHAPGGAVAFFSIRGAWGTVDAFGSTVINDNVWHLVAGSLGADDSVKVWVDGVLDDKDYSVNGPANEASIRMQIGGRYGAMLFDGTLDEPMVYNRELTPSEHLSLYASGSPGAGQHYPFPGEGSGGDSLNMVIEGEDTRADTMYVLWKYDGWSTDTTDGNLLFRIPIDDMEDYRDTTFLSPVRGDSLAYFTALTKWGTSVTPKGNQDTVFVDSSDLVPPPQDLPGFDILFEKDMGSHTGLPKEYTYALWLADDWNCLANAEGPADDRSSEHRTAGWVGHNNDSIIVDPITGSNVIQFSMCGHTINGYTCNSSLRGGDAWKPYLPEGYYTETYVSYNILLKAGWLRSRGGKLGVGQSGGLEFPHASGPSRPNSNEGFTNEIMWDYSRGQLEWYLYWQDMTTTYGTPIYWDEFQPTGHGVPYNEYGEVVLETETWYNITTRTVLNTFTGPSTANHDGILEAYVNGALIQRTSGLQLLPYSNKDIGLDHIFVAVFFGGGGPALREERIYLDDIVVFTYAVGVDVPRGNELSPPGRVLSLPEGVWPKEVE